MVLPGLPISEHCPTRAGQQSDGGEVAFMRYMFRTMRLMLRMEPTYGAFS